MIGFRRRAVFLAFGFGARAFDLLRALALFISKIVRAASASASVRIAAGTRGMDVLRLEKSRSTQVDHLAPCRRRAAPWAGALRGGEDAAAVVLTCLCFEYHQSARSSVRIEQPARLASLRHARV